MLNLRKPVSAIFNDALEIEDADARAAYLAQASAGDDTLRQKLENLIEAHHAAGGFLQGASEGERPTVADPHSRSGNRIGPYKPLQQIGEGGCGVVYMAEQEEPVRRRVALKVIKPGMDSRQVIARFEAERQALALMDHPNIAKFLDAGTTDTGRPYFVMELVRGTRITEYCEERELSTPQRLDLFVQVCHAIHHAHQKGIIHRDIKPSNILVTISDGGSVPKIIDFGIARATEQRLTDKTLFTAFQQFLGTPAYMSPEQADVTSLDIDTRSDVYALGVLLYELLTGKTPFDATTLVAAGLDEMRRTIRETEPPPPSNRLTRELATAQTALRGKLTSGLAIPSAAEVNAAARRRLRLKEQIQLLRGDLDWIVMKCLEKQRARRYETVNALVHDIERHLGHEPILARPPSTGYKLRKFAQRNRRTVVAVTAIGLALLIGALTSTWLAVRATRAERAQEANARQARAAQGLAEAQGERARQQVI